MLNKIYNKQNNIHVSIGEEGIAVVYFIADKAARKLFIRTTSDEDTIELRKILLSDNEALIHIYIDVLDQTYIQRTLPAISVFNINKLAEQRLEKETIKTHLKSYLQIGRTGVGRNDWVYMFISTAFEPPISTWIKFFEEYQNIIHGIHFLPIELSVLVKNLKNNRETSNNLLKVKNLIPKIKIKKGESGSVSTWEVLLVLNKSGGFRQAVFQNGKVIFTRLLNNLIDPNPDVIAGSIEQEIINSIEYLRRLSSKEKVEVNINIIVSSEIKRNIRRNKFNAKDVRIYTPYEVSNLLQIPDDVTRENDRFCDPIILTLMHTNRRRVVTVHTEETKKVLLYTRLFNFLLVSVKLSIPVLIVIMLICTSNIISLINRMKGFQFKETQLIASLTNMTVKKNDEDKKLGSNIDAQEVEEVVELYDKYKQYDTDPLDLLQKLGQVRPDLAKTNHIEISYQVPDLKYTPKSDGIGYEKSDWKNFIFIGRFSINFKNYGNTYEELKTNYDNYTKELALAFKNYSVKVSSLPDNFTFADFKKPFSLQVVIQTPVQNNEQQK